MVHCVIKLSLSQDVIASTALGFLWYMLITYCIFIRVCYFLGKFSWQKAIKTLLKNAGEDGISLKRLRKKVGPLKAF